MPVPLISYNGHIEVHNSLLSAVLHEKLQLKEDNWGSNPDPKDGLSTGRTQAIGLETSLGKMRRPFR